MVEKNPHISELFETGRLETFDFGEEIGKILIWLEKPSTVQQDDAMTKAKAKRSRLIMAHKDKTSDEYMALEGELQLATDEEALEGMLAVKRDELNRQALNEVLHGESGSDWGESGEDYVALLDAVQQRLDEMEEHNKALTEEDAHLVIIPAEDTEMIRLLEIENRFAAEVKERRDALLATEEARLKGLGYTKLREVYRDTRINLEGELLWFQEYKMWMIYYACRYPEKHEKSYFTNKDQLMQLPSWVQQEILSRYDDFDQGGESTKKLLSQLPSSDSSESSKELAVTSQPSGPKE